MPWVACFERGGRHSDTTPSSHRMQSFPNTKLSYDARTYVNYEPYLRNLHEYTATSGRLRVLPSQ